MTKPALPRRSVWVSAGFVVAGTFAVLAPLLVGVGTATATAESSDSGARFSLRYVAPIEVAGNGSGAAGSVDSPQVSRVGSTGLTEKRVIGTSVQGRKIVARLYGPADATKVAVVIGSMHGTELGGVPIAKKLEKLGAPTGTAMWVIRDLNPDGSRAKRRGNANKVDLNRNGTHLWQSTARAPDYYPGPSAASEPETRAYISFFESVKPDVVLIYHQRGNGVDSYRQKNAGLTQGLARRMKLPVKSFNCDGECTGTLTGWFNTTQAGAALTVELTDSVSSKKVNRWAKAAQWSVTYVPDVN